MRGLRLSSSRFLGRPARHAPSSRNASFQRRLLTKAYAEGPTEPPLLEDTVPGHFRRIVKSHGDRIAVVSSHQQQRLTYHELNQNANSLARGFQDIGVRKGDRVAVMLGNNVEYAITTYAMYKLGAILVPLNPAFGGQQIVSALNHLAASHLVISTETNLPFKPPRPNETIFEQLIPDLSASKIASDLVPSLSQVVLIDNSNGRSKTEEFRALIPFQELLTSSPAGADLAISNSLDPHDIINIQFTSGTTSTPKAACLSHRSILNNGHQIGSRMLLTPNDRVICPPPMFHCFGSILGLMATATHGASLILPAEAFSPSASLQAVIDEKGTALYGVPTMFISELDLLASPETKHHYPREGLSHLRTGIAAGSSIPAELMRKLHRDLNLTEITIAYGMTETSPGSFMTFTDDPLEKRISTVGRLLPHVRAKIIDPLDRSRIVDIGERGELVVAGYLTMKEYWNDKKRTDENLVRDENATDENFRHWMHTGDEAVMDSEGYVSITGRIKDLIIRGGENIHPLELENCLLSHPSVSDASVVGIPDEKYGEVVGAFIILTKTSVASAADEKRAEKLVQDLQDHVKDALSHHLAPKYVFFVDEYPKTASGKIQKFKLREIGGKLAETQLNK